MKFLIRNKYFLATIPWCTHMAGEGFQLGLNAKANILAIMVAGNYL